VYVLLLSDFNIEDILTTRIYGCISHGQVIWRIGSDSISAGRSVLNCTKIGTDLGLDHQIILGEPEKHLVSEEFEPRGSEIEKCE